MTSLDLETDQVIAAVDRGVGRLTFNNPERRNALTIDMSRAASAVLAAFDADQEVRVIVIAGAGDQAFMSGADIFEQGDPEKAAAFKAAAAHMLRALESAEKPIIAEIRGYCLGGGLTTALKADIRVAAEQSTFGVPAARLGVGYPFSEVERLVALVGPAWAADILYSGRHLAAGEALRAGLVQEICSDSELDRRVAERAATIAANAPLTIRAAKAAICQSLRPAAERDLDEVERLVAACWASDDYVEGRRAFQEKRTPQFRGR